MSADLPNEWAAWREMRQRTVASVPGNLSLVSYQAVTEVPEEIDGVSGATVRRERGRPGVVVSAPGSAGLTVDDESIDGETWVGLVGPSGGPVIRAGNHAFDVFTLDGSDYELRIYDQTAENLDNFDGIDAFDHDPAFAVPGEFRRLEETSQVAWDFTRAADSGHMKRVPGTVTVDLPHGEHELVAFLDGEALVIVFADSTTGAESYAPGRFLRVPTPDSGADLTVDFNFAFVPPCGFSDFYSCPIPPAQNKIPSPVRAGEKSVRWKTPRY